LKIAGINMNVRQVLGPDIRTLPQQVWVTSINTVHPLIGNKNKWLY
jgi:hypothetical protein